MPPRFLPSPLGGEGRTRAPARQQNVRRLKVAMDDTGLVGVLHSASKFLHQAGCGTGWLGLARHVRGERAAVEVFKREERTAFRLTDLVNLDDVGMMQVRDRLGFAT